MVGGILPATESRLYASVPVAARRIQITLTPEQRRRLDDLVREQGTSLAAVIRQAVDQFLADEEPDPTLALESTFATMPDLQVPDRDEWDRG